MFFGCEKEPVQYLTQIETTIEAGTEIDPLMLVSTINNEDIMVKKNEIDINKPGKYKVLYEIINKKGKSVEEAYIFTVIDSSPPIIESEDIIEIYVGDDFNLSEVFHCTDNVDEKPLIKISGDTVNTNSPGEYNVTCTATDGSENSTIKDIIVSVVENRKNYEPDKIIKDIKPFLTTLMENGARLEARRDDYGFYRIMTYKKDAKIKKNMLNIDTVYAEVIQNQTKRNLYLSIYLDGKSINPLRVTISNGSDDFTLHTADMYISNYLFGLDIISIEEGDSDVNDKNYNALKKMLSDSGDIKIYIETREKDETITLTKKQKKNFKNLLQVFDEFLTYY